ncbi:uncharacterized protein [Montipora foliosa]|uniref:uncharacterized protein n=1 Tax=Montipora foliosa TaxID=591990 RepID=UPI0035F1758B
MTDTGFIQSNSNKMKTDKGKCVNGSTCLNQFCTSFSSSDCSSGESCCNSQCRHGFDCSGYSCSFSSDCSIGQSCCNGVCTFDSYDCEEPTPLIIGSVLGSLITFFLVLSLIYCLCRRRRPVGSGRVIEGGRVTTTIATAHSVVHVPPEGYQQSYPYYPPPQYNQYQNSAAPPYSDRATQGSDLPPPYPTTYGAVQTSPS